MSGVAHAHRPFVHRVRDAAGTRQLPAALSELVRHRVGRPVRARVVDVHPQVLELHLERGPRRGDLVPVHQHAVGEGVDRRRRTSRCSRSRSTARTTTRSPTTCRRRSPTSSGRSSPALRRWHRHSVRPRSRVVGAGLIATGTWDIWGWSKNSLLYVRPTTLRVTANGYAILTSRANIQRVVNEFATTYNTKLNAYKAAGQVPDERTGRDPRDRTRQDQRGRRRQRGAAVALGRAAAARPHRLGRRGVARHPHDPGHAVRGAVLPGDRAVDLLELLGFVRVGAAGMVEGVGLLEHGRVVRLDDARHDRSGRRSTRASPRARSSPTPAPRSTRSTRRAIFSNSFIDTFLP